MRTVVFRFENVSAFSVALEEARGSLTIPRGETVVDGEWVLAVFEIGSRRRATAAAARAVRAAGDPHLAFEQRDWERLRAFAAARSEQSRPPPREPEPIDGAGEPAAERTEIRPVLGRLGRLGSAASGPPEAPTSEPPPASCVESNRIGGCGRILLVDDDDERRDAVRAMLIEVGLDVIVTTADEAAARIQHEAFDALVLDFHAPGMDALGFVRRLRQSPEWAPLPVLILSDGWCSREAVEAFACGADDYLPKPFRPPELGARIFGLLRRARLERAAARGEAAGPLSGSGETRGRA